MRKNELLNIKRYIFKNITQRPLIKPGGEEEEETVKIMSWESQVYTLPCNAAVEHLGMNFLRSNLVQLIAWS